MRALSISLTRDLIDGMMNKSPYMTVIHFAAGLKNEKACCCLEMENGAVSNLSAMFEGSDYRLHVLDLLTAGLLKRSFQLHVADGAVLFDFEQISRQSASICMAKCFSDLGGCLFFFFFF